MGILSDNYKNHPVHQEMETTLKFIEDYKQKENLTDANKDSLEAYENLLKYAQYVLNNSITQVVPTQLLNNLQNNIHQLRSTNVVNIETTYNVYANITADLCKIPTYNDKSIVRIGVGKIIENFNNEKDNIKQSISTEIDNFRQRQNDELEKWEVEKKEYEKQIEELKLENQSIHAEMDKLTKDISSEKARLSEISLNFQTNYDAKMKEYQKEFEKKQEDDDEEFKNAQTKMLTIFNDFHDSNKARTEALLKYMENKQTDVEKLWGIIGKASVSGSSQSYADRAKNFAHTMMTISLLIMLGVIAFLAVTFYKDASSPNFNPLNLLYRIPLGFTLFLPAWYCASIANKQRNREFQLRDFEIKTAGLEPFMENMRMIKCNDCAGDDKPNKKDETKLELVRDIFQNDLNRKKVDDGNIIIPKDIVTTIQSCLETWSKIKGKNE